MSPDIRDAMEEVKFELGWAYDLIKYELDRLEAENVLLKSYVTRWMPLPIYKPDLEDT